MMNFLLKTKSDGTILDVVWCEPAYLMFIVDSPIGSYFLMEHRKAIETGIKGAFETSAFECKTNDGSSISLVFTRLGNDVLIFGYQADQDRMIQETGFLDVIHRFIDILKNDNTMKERYGIEGQTLNFEKIQMLNNDLINMQRKLEKVNAQLNAANQLLSNRLVRDELTGLVSRYQYRQEIDLLIRKFPAAYGIFAFLDIDYFKNVNDSYGHVVGDRYLIEFATRLKNISLENMICIRISGDEFGLFHQIVPQGSVDEVILDLWRHITTEVIHKPIEIDGKSIPISVSVGMAVYNLDTANVYDLIDYADYAMYLAKRAGKNRFSRFDIDTYLRAKGEEK